MKKDVRQILEELSAIRKQLSEDYMFDGYDQQPVEASDEQPVAQDMQQQQPMDAAGSEEEIAMHAQEVIQHEPIIGKIRETAIEGLKKYADHPTSSLYEFFKKVFLESDKVLTDTGGKK